MRSWILSRYLLVPCLALLLAGCSAAGGMPPYVVMLTSSWPGAYGQCTGVVLDNQRILTADHCSGMDRVVTQSGQASNVSVERKWVESDIAILLSEEPLALTSYAELALPTVGTLAKVWALCPYYFPGTTRFATYLGEVREEVEGTEYEYDQWTTSSVMGDSQGICGGDSGGAVVQGGRVVGIISAVYSEVLWTGFGQLFYTVGSSDIVALMKE